MTTARRYYLAGLEIGAAPRAAMSRKNAQRARQLLSVVSGISAIVSGSPLGILLFLLPVP